MAKKSKRVGQVFRGGFKLGEELHELGIALHKIMNRVGIDGDPALWTKEQRDTYAAYYKNLQEELSDVKAMIRYFERHNKIKSDTKRIFEKMKNYTAKDLPGVLINNTVEYPGMPMFEKAPRLRKGSRKG